MTVNFRGYLYDDSGNAIQGATVQLLEQSGTEEATTTTSAAGLWAFSEADQDTYDVKITSGSSVRYIQWDDQISLKEIDARNNTGATTPAATFTNTTNAVANQVAVFSGANSTRADNDEVYLSFKLADSAGNIDEFARITVVASDVTSGSEDGQIEFDVLQGGSLIKAFTISSSTAGAQSIDFNQDSITFGTGTAATDITLTFDAESADGVITWMEDEDYFQFSDDILMSTTERINLRDTAIYIYSSADGQLDLIADTEIQIAATTVDINGAVAFDGALTGITNITLSGTLSDGNYTFDTSGNVSGLGTIASGAITSSGIVTGTGFTAGSAVLAEAELELLDGITAGTAAASKAVVLDGSKNIATIGTIGSGAITSTGTSSFATAIQTPLIEYTDGDDAITIADGGGITAAAGITSTAAANSFGATSFGDASITNVNDIALDSISADGTDINIAVSDNSATALTIKQGSDAYLIIDTANSSESVSIGTSVSGTAITLGHGTSEVTVGDNLTVTGDLTVSGTTTTITSTTVAIADSLLKLAKDQGTSADAVDFGFYGQYGESGTAKWAGIFRDGSATGDPWTFFDAVEAEPGTTVNVGGTGYDLADISAGGITAADTLTFGSLSDGAITITAFIDDEDMVADSATLVPTQRSVKAYVDSLGASGANTAITSIYNTSLKLGRDADNLIDFGTTDDKVILRVSGVNEVELVADVLQPTTSDGVALGTASLMWSDLFIASGGVINFNNGDMTLTHSAGTLTAAGGTVATAAIVASGIVKTDDTTNATSTTDGSLQTDGGLSVALDTILGDDLYLITDSAVLGFGAGKDATLTHTNDVGLTLNGTNKLMFNDASQFVQGSSATVLSIGATDEIDLSATTIDVNGTMNVSGVLTTQAGFAVGSDAAGDVLYSNGTAYVRLAKGSDDQVLTLASGVPSWAAAGGSGPDIQQFTTAGSGTSWSKPAGATFVRVILLGGGGGGGSGRRGAGSTNRYGGGGGGGGGHLVSDFLASDLASTVAVVVGAGGAGAASVTGDNTNGAVGTSGINTTFGSTLAIGGGGMGGGGGTTAAVGTVGFGGGVIGLATGQDDSDAGGNMRGQGAVVSAAGPQGDHAGGGGGSSYAINPASAPYAGAGGSSTFGGGGGAAGQALASDNEENAGNSGGAGNNYTVPYGGGGAGGAAGGGAGAAGAASAHTGIGGSGGGGGGADADGSGGAGGAGGQDGGGGGGGAATLNNEGTTSGAGGVGGTGYAMIISF